VSRSATSRTDGAAHDGRGLTLDRDEHKYLIPPARLAGFVRALRARLRPHRFTGEGANRLPEAQHFTTTVYFDTPSRALLHAAQSDPERNVKLRAREYYDVHSSLAELATDPEQIVRHQPWIFLELKRREGMRSTKHRLRLDKRALSDFFAQAPDAAGHDDDAGARAAILAFSRSHAEPLAPSCVVNYRRVAFEDQPGQLRVTLDVELAFYAPPAQLWTSTGALARGGLSAPRAGAPACLLEIKQRDGTPDWLAHALEAAQASPERVSKFVLASEAVHGRD
jgi:hypothetical protein